MAVPAFCSRLSEGSQAASGTEMSSGDPRVSQASVGDTGAVPTPRAAAGVSVLVRLCVRVQDGRSPSLPEGVKPKSPISPIFSAGRTGQGRTGAPSGSP